MIVEGGFAPSDASARQKCAAIAKGLGRKAVVSTIRALESGPVKLSDRKDKTLYEKVRTDGFHALKKSFLLCISRREGGFLSCCSFSRSHLDTYYRPACPLYGPKA
jgi:hypothetical protein